MKQALLQRSIIRKKSKGLQLDYSVKRRFKQWKSHREASPAAAHTVPNSAKISLHICYEQKSWVPIFKVRLR